MGGNRLFVTVQTWPVAVIILKWRSRGQASQPLRVVFMWRTGGQGPRMRDRQFGRSNSGHKESAMNWDIVKGNWKQFRGKVKAQWGNLTDDHLDVIAGKRDELVGKIQESYGITKDEAERQIKEFEQRH
jgi:uncharacterized protein YjbJ (UPF0337 family)